MATPYFQLHVERVPSTQDVARSELVALPVLVLASGQTKGRGRSGSEWVNADRALAVSLAFHHREGDNRPFSLMAGVAAVRSTEGTRLKWPNDVLVADSKVGGILVERSGAVTVVGLGLNLWWPSPTHGAGALFARDPGGDKHAEIGALWGAELMELLEDRSWPIDEYRQACNTIGRDVTWEPTGSGRAVDVDEDGSLLVRRRDGKVTAIRSGAISHLRVV